MGLKNTDEPKVFVVSLVKEGLEDFFDLNGYPASVALAAMNSLIIETYFDRFPLEQALKFADLFKRQILEKYERES